MPTVNQENTRDKQSHSLWMHAVVALALTVTSASSATAQDDVSHQFWIDYHRHFHLSRDWENFGDVGFRMDPSNWQRVYARPSLRWHSPRNPFEGRGGLGVFYEFNNDRDDRLELRPWLGALLKWPRLGPLTISSYIRLEGRFIWNTSDWDGRETLRLRYKLGTKIPLWRDHKSEYLFLPVAVELFDAVGQPQINDTFVENWRFYVGLGRVFSETIAGNLYFIVQSARAETDEPFETADYIFRVQINHMWSTRGFMSQEP